MFVGECKIFFIITRCDITKLLANNMLLTSAYLKDPAEIISLLRKIFGGSMING